MYNFFKISFVFVCAALISNVAMAQNQYSQQQTQQTYQTQQTVQYQQYPQQNTQYQQLPENQYVTTTDGQIVQYVQTTPDGQQVIYVQTIDGRFIPYNQAFGAAYQTNSKNYVVTKYPTVVKKQTDNADGVFDLAKGKAVLVFRHIRSIVFILGGFALIGLAVMAIFGKPNWKWFAMLVIGIFVVAVAGAIVEFLGGQTTDLGNTIDTQPQQQVIYQQPVQQQPVYR